MSFYVFFILFILKCVHKRPFQPFVLIYIRERKIAYKRKRPAGGRTLEPAVGKGVRVRKNNTMLLSPPNVPTDDLSDLLCTTI